MYLSLTLLHGALIYCDERWQAADAVALVEVIEHLEPDRLSALTDVVFGSARPKTVIVTTPNTTLSSRNFPIQPTLKVRGPEDSQDHLWS